MAARLIWFREQKPDWSIETELINESMFKATIRDQSGKVMSTAHKAGVNLKQENTSEKSETGAIGRALAMCGFGTQFTDDFEEGEALADAPQEKKSYSPPAGQPLKNFAKAGQASEKQIKMIQFQFQRVGTSPVGRSNFLNNKAINDLTVGEASVLFCGNKTHCGP